MRCSTLTCRRCLKKNRPGADLCRRLTTHPLLYRALICQSILIHDQREEMHGASRQFAISMLDIVSAKSL